MNNQQFDEDFIELWPYDPKWPLLAEAEMEKIRNNFPAEFILDIEHVGSTAVPGLLAKPIIDIQIAVNSLEEAKLIAVPVLQKMGYEFWFDNPDETRLFFVKGIPPYGERRTHHVHIVLLDSHHGKDKLRFRDYLRKHPGSFADRIGAKHAYLAGLIIFTLTSLGCGLWPNFLILTVMRLLQAAGAALLVPTSLAHEFRVYGHLGRENRGSLLEKNFL